jgi:hypothetical protein
MRSFLAGLQAGHVRHVLATLLVEEHRLRRRRRRAIDLLQIDENVRQTSPGAGDVEARLGLLVGPKFAAGRIEGEVLLGRRCPFEGDLAADIGRVRRGHADEHQHAGQRFYSSNHVCFQNSSQCA